jgi:hypothetical protein
LTHLFALLQTVKSPAMDPGNPGVDSRSPPPFPPTSDAAGKQKEVEDRLGQLLERWKPLRDAASLHNSKWQRDADALAHQAAALLADVDDLQSVVASASDKEDIAHQSAQKVSHSLFLFPFRCGSWYALDPCFFFSWLILRFCGLKFIIRKARTAEGLF